MEKFINPFSTEVEQNYKEKNKILKRQRGKKKHMITLETEEQSKV